MNDQELMTEFLIEFERNFIDLARIMANIQKTEISKEYKAVVIKGMICAMLDELSSEDVKDLINTYPEMSGREDLK